MGYDRVLGSIRPRTTAVQLSSLDSATIFSCSSNNDVQALSTVKEVTLHKIDTSLDHSQPVVCSGKTNIGVKIDLDHSTLGGKEKVVKIILTKCSKLKNKTENQKMGTHSHYYKNLPASRVT